MKNDFMNNCVQAASRMYFNSQFFPGMGGMGGMMGSIKAAGGMMGGMKGGIPGFMSGLDSMGAMAGKYLKDYIFLNRIKVNLSKT